MRQDTGKTEEAKTMSKIKTWVNQLALYVTGDPQKNYDKIEKLYKKMIQERRDRFNSFDSLSDRIRSEYDNYLKNKIFPYYGQLNFQDISVKEDFKKALDCFNEKGLNIGFPEGSSLRLIQISFGPTPCGITEYTKSGNVKGITEDGGILSFSQSPTGHISVFIFPRKSDYIKREEDFIIYSSNKDPRDIELPQIRSALKFFLYYMTTSSVYGKPSFCIEFLVYLKKIYTNIRFSQLSSWVKELLFKIPSFLK